MRLNLLLPARQRVDSVILAHWLARGDRLPDAVPGRAAVLRECFDIGAAEFPMAALTRQVDAGDAADSIWLRADPAFVMADAVTLRLLACGNLGLSAEDVQACAQALKPLFDDMGFYFDAPHPQRWYLRCPPETTLPTFSSPDDALGDDLARHLPEGENVRRWRGLLNEAQIVLTQHPLNAQRARRGLPPVNSVWFWGAGVLPARVHSDFDCIISDDEVIVAMARIENKPSFPRKRESSSTLFREAQKLDSRLRGNDEPKQMQAVLIDLADQRDAAQLDDEWFAPIDAALRSGPLAQLDLRFESGDRYVARPAHRWRFWRRTKPSA